jgi:hypothetical protein
MSAEENNCSSTAMTINSEAFKTHRRAFMGTALATAASYRRILGANDRIQIGAIGTGQRCQYLLSLLNKARPHGQLPRLRPITRGPQCSC